MARMGMDPDLVEGSANQIINKANELNQIRSDLKQLIASLSSAWDGQDVKQFQSDFDKTHARTLAMLDHALKHLAQVAKKNAGRQREASQRL